MAIELRKLTKGERIEIGLKRAGLGLGWDPTTGASPNDYDLDAVAFVLGESGKLLSEQHFIYYGNLQTPTGSVQSLGDNRTGQGEGDDETILANLESLEPAAEQIILGVSIYEAEQRHQNFGQIRNSFIRIYNSETGEEICKYELDEDFSIETAVEFGRLYRKNGVWKFEASGIGYKGGLQEFLNRYS